MSGSRGVDGRHARAADGGTYPFSGAYGEHPTERRGTGDLSSLVDSRGGVEQDEEINDE